MLRTQFIFAQMIAATLQFHQWERLLNVDGKVQTNEKKKKVWINLGTECVCFYLAWAKKEMKSSEAKNFCSANLKIIGKVEVEIHVWGKL